MQDTGWSAHLPSGAGLIPFSTVEEALDGLARIESDYALQSARAVAIAQECFDAARVLPRLLEAAGRVTRDDVEMRTCNPGAARNGNRDDHACR